MRKATLAGLSQARKTAQGFCFKAENGFKRADKQSSRKDCSGVGLETGRFQPAMRQEPI
ncbi:hypothetical protein [Desulfitobacterium dehalogenans]|uniref:hypothetical protein n=1 Tax=Desulfitobacterium dehalogenans TaxID=36854 RepID=UPI0002ECDD61|nr:hypothetical protein [Desulfitobacterium dehalogenans]